MYNFENVHLKCTPRPFQISKYVTGDELYGRRWNLRRHGRFNSSSLVHGVFVTYPHTELHGGQSNSLWRLFMFHSSISSAESRCSVYERPSARARYTLRQFCPPSLCPSILRLSITLVHCGNGWGNRAGLLKSRSVPHCVIRKFLSPNFPPNSEFVVLWNCHTDSVVNLNQVRTSQVENWDNIKHLTSFVGTCESAVCVRIEFRIESFQLQQILITKISNYTNEAKEMCGTTHSSLQSSYTH